MYATTKRELKRHIKKLWLIISCRGGHKWKWGCSVGSPKGNEMHYESHQYDCIRCGISKVIRLSEPEIRYKNRD